MDHFDFSQGRNKAHWERRDCVRGGGGSLDGKEIQEVRLALFYEVCDFVSLQITEKENTKENPVEKCSYACLHV